MASASIVAVAFIQFLLVSFAVPCTPPKLALLGVENDGDFQALQREWVFFQPEYFGIAGPPRSENWHLADILVRVPPGSKVGVLPELPRFNLNGLQLEAARSGRKLEALALGNLSDWKSRLGNLDMVVAKTGDQGFSFITRFNRDINEALESGDWSIVACWSLPDGSQALLMQRRTEPHRMKNEGDSDTSTPTRREPREEASACSSVEPEP